MWLQPRDKIDNTNLNSNLLFQYYPRIMSICDGLVCAILGNSEIIICNPSIRRVCKLPGLGIMDDNVLLGFGFQNNEYKLFKIVVSISESEVVVHAWVYLMGTNLWREIEVNQRVIYTRLRIAFSMPTAINDVFYWMGYRFDAPCGVYFDMNGYVFGVIDCPETIIIADRFYGIYWQLVNFKGELALTCNCKGTIRIEMWVLNEKERYWTMKFKTEDFPFNQSLRVLGCERNGNIAMRYNSSNSERKLFSYDPESHDIKFLPFAGPKESKAANPMIVYLYTESLLSV